MPIQLQFRRGNTIQNSAFVGAEGEVTVDTAKRILVVHDGLTTGGNPLAAASDLTTANVSENNNLYFTNARARGAISSGTGVNFNGTTGAISISQNVDTTSNVTFQNLLVTGNLTVTGNTVSLGVTSLSVEDNMIYLNANSDVSNPDLGFAGNYNDGVYHHAGLFRDATDGVWKFYDNYGPEPDASAFIDTGHATFRLSNVQINTLFGNVSGTVTGNVVGNVTGRISTLDNHTTSNLVEGSNLYFTNTRAIGAVTGGAGITIAANGRITATESFLGTISSVAGVSSGAVSNAQIYAGAAAGGTIGTITSVGGVNSGAVSNAQIYNAAAAGGTIGTLTTGKSIAMALVFGG